MTSDVSRQSLSCRHFASCSGCSMDEGLHHPSISTVAQAFFLTLGLESFPIIYGEGHKWRCRAKLAVRGSTKAPLIGLFEEHSHKVVPIVDCVVHHPLINSALQKVRVKMQQLGLDPYDEQKHTGLIRYLQFFVCRRENTVQLTVVANLLPAKSPLCDLLKTFLQQLWREEGTTFWHSLWLNFNDKRNNVIFGSEWERIEGPEYLIEHFLAQPFCFQPMVFSQANPRLFEEILKEVALHISPGKKVIELYAGIGVIGRSAAREAPCVIFCESHPEAERLFHQSLKEQKECALSSLPFHSGPVASHLSLLSQGEVLIVDPPRKGLDAALLDVLQGQEHTIEKIIYVSCGFESLRRDVVKLVQAGWQLTTAQGYVLFPGSNHIETLVIFFRNP